jgi:hypothetical protein
MLWRTPKRGKEDNVTDFFEEHARPHQPERHNNEGPYSLCLWCQRGA